MGLSVEGNSILAWCVPILTGRHACAESFIIFEGFIDFLSICSL